jgi:hypothetical protein
MDIIILIVLVCVIIFAIIKRRSVANGQVTNEPLSGGEKVFVWITTLLNPIWAGAIYYFTWKGKLPTKAKQANKISFVAFLLVVLIIVLYSIMSGGVAEV